jgi:thioredoxin-like negative regulator of GroEL
MVNVDAPEQIEAAALGAESHARLVVVAFFSPECYACRSMQPKLRQIARDAGPGRVVMLKVNGYTDGLREYCEAEGITQIPYFHFYRSGARVAAFSANMQPEKLRLLRRTIELHAPPAAPEDEAGGGSA